MVACKSSFVPRFGEYHFVVAVFGTFEIGTPDLGPNTWVKCRHELLRDSTSDFGSSGVLNRRI